jgi:hypothetical protein
VEREAAAQNHLISRKGPHREREPAREGDAERRVGLNYAHLTGASKEDSDGAAPQVHRRNAWRIGDTCPRKRSLEKGLDIVGSDRVGRGKAIPTLEVGRQSRHDFAHPAGSGIGQPDVAWELTCDKLDQL